MLAAASVAFAAASDALDAAAAAALFASVIR